MSDVAAHGCSRRCRRQGCKLIMDLIYLALLLLLFFICVGLVCAIERLGDDA